MREYVVWLNDDTQKVRIDYGWFIEAEDEKALVDKYGDKLIKATELTSVMPKQMYEVSMRLGINDTPHTAPYHARCEAEAIQMAVEDYWIRCVLVVGVKRL